MSAKDLEYEEELQAALDELIEDSIEMEARDSSDAEEEPVDEEAVARLNNYAMDLVKQHGLITE